MSDLNRTDDNRYSLKNEGEVLNTDREGDCSALLVQMLKNGRTRRFKQGQIRD